MIENNKYIIPIYDDLNFLLNNCDGLILDIWGVLWDGMKVYPDAVDTLRSFNKNNIPDPTNSDVEVINIEGGYYAVIRYSGRASEKNFIKHKSILEDQLTKDNIQIQSPPIKATYNSPFTLPIMRRNEAMFRVEYKN